MAYERITVVGNIGAVEALKSQAGVPYLKISLAVQRGNGDAKVVVWYTVLMFGALARDIDKLLMLYTRGRLILVEGRPQTEPFIKRDGTAGVDNTIVAISIPELLDSRPRN